MKRIKANLLAIVCLTTLCSAAPALGMNKANEKEMMRQILQNPLFVWQEKIRRHLGKGTPEQREQFKNAFPAALSPLLSDEQSVFSYIQEQMKKKKQKKQKKQNNN